MEQFMLGIERAVWGWPLLGLILGTGLYLTVRLHGLPLRRLGQAMRLLIRSTGKSSGVSGFGALCTSLAATIGTGNIVGVASAIALGGPGALFWMELSALTGMSVKFAEGWLAVRWRLLRPDGKPHGGPFAYIRLGLGEKWNPLARMFSFFGAAAGLLGVGTFVQAGSIAAGLRYFLERTVPNGSEIRFFGQMIPPVLPVLSLLLTIGAACLILGGIRRISRLSSVLVPVMGLLYVGCCAWILLRCAHLLPNVLRTVLRTAFHPEALSGALLGTIQAGVSRGVFSNEAGVGTAPIASACAETGSPFEQGLITMTSSVFDTLLICTMTGLVILCAAPSAAEAGIWSVMEAFARGLPVPEAFGRGVVLACLFLFAFTTIVGWSYYGTECLDDLTGGKTVFRRIYLTVYISTIFFAPFFPVQLLWSAASICNGLMAIPNLIAILLLSPAICLDAYDIMNSKKQRGG